MGVVRVSQPRGIYRRLSNLQDELAALSFHNIHYVVEGATHASLLFDRRDVQVTSAAILKVVEAVRNDRAHRW